MPKKKLTEKPQVNIVSQSANVLITQEVPDGANVKEATRRAPLAAIVAALRAAGINAGLVTSSTLDSMGSEMVKNVTKEGNKLIVSFWDDDKEEIELGTSGKDFDGMYQDANGFFHITLKGVDIVEPAKIAGGSGKADDSLVRITNGMASQTLTVLSSLTVFNLEYSWSSIDTQQETPTGRGTAIWYVNGTRVDTQTNLAQGAQSYNIRPHLSSGIDNIVRLTIEDVYGVTKSFSWTMTVSDVRLSWSLSGIGVYGENNLTVLVTPTGQTEKTIHITLDGDDFYSTTTTANGRELSIVIPAQSHGAHTIEAWMTTVIDGQTIATEHMRHIGIWTQDGVSTPIIAVENDDITLSQYETGSLKWLVFDPQSEVASVTQRINGTDTSVLAVGRTEQIWAYRPTIVGTDTLTLRCGSISKNITVTVTSLGYDIHEVPGAVMKIDPTGHSNAEAGYDQFGYVTQTWETVNNETVLVSSTNHPFTYSQNFDWNSGGFQRDNNGVTAFVIKRGCYVEADYSLFSDFIADTGKEIKMIFKTVNNRVLDSTILSCKADGIGVVVKNTRAILSSNLSTVEVPFCTDEQIEMDINIERAADATDRFAVLWLKGIPSTTVQFSQDDDWQQTTPAPIRIGSDDADVWIYLVKQYPTRLSRQSINENYISDCRDTEEMLARYLRNQIFAVREGTREIDMTLLAKANPRLRIHHFTCAAMTYGKEDEDKVKCTFRQIYAGGGAEHNFTAIGATFKGQGTSSIALGKSALNIDIDLSTATSWKDNDGNDMTGYSMTPNSIPVAYFNDKLDVASSDLSANTVEADDYNTFNPCLSLARVADPRVRDCIEGYPCAIFFTNDGTEPFYIGSQIVNPGETKFYGCGDMNNSKKNYAVFGQTSEYPDTFCVEILNNNNPQCLFKSDDLSTETWDGEEETSNFEFRYPKKPTAEMKAKVQQVLSWVVSTNPEAATGTTLPSPVTFTFTDKSGEDYTETYAVDNAAYRHAKFRAEVADWFAVDSLAFHYLKTSRNLMTDNRAKNTFMSWEPIASLDGAYRFTFSKNYDNDTCEGTDNSGHLSFVYGLEDTDDWNGAKVFNAYDSVLWCNVRDCLVNELESMYRELEKKGAWSAERLIAKFDNYRSARPEALVAEDMYNKYMLPVKTWEDTQFIRRMNGSKEFFIKLFERLMEPYFASKYEGSQATTADLIEFRASSQITDPALEPSGDMTIVPWQDMYVHVRYGNAGRVKVRAKAGQRVNIICPTDNLVDTETYIYLASKVALVDGIASLYTRVANLSAAEKLQQVILGSDVEGYSNQRLESIGFGSNQPMLEKIDITGMPNLKVPLDLSGLSSLKELYATNSGITSVTFAPSAPVKTVWLPQVTAITARNLRQIETFMVNPNSLTNLWIENCPGIDTLALVEGAPSLARGRLVGVNWRMNNPDVLLRLSNLAGRSDTGGNTDHFVLTGTCYVASASAEEQVALVEAFPDLTITFGSTADSFTVTFKDTDGTVLDVQTVRQYGAAQNPVTRSTNPIPTPTKASTVDTTYTFIGWDTPFSNIIANTVVTAVYREATRTYTVRYWDGTRLLQTNTVEAYGSAPYEGADLSSQTGALWMGFDKTANSVTSDMDIYAVYVTPTLPDSVATGYTYLYSDDPADAAVSGYTIAEFYGIITSGRVKEYFNVGDQIKIVPNTTAFADSSIIMQVFGFNHYKLADGSGEFAKVVFGMKGIMNAYRQMNSTNTNAGGYGATSMHNFLENVVYPALPQQWKAMIKAVNVLSSAGETKDTILTTAAHLFLFSQIEVGFSKSGATYEVPYLNEVDPDAEEKTFSIFTDNASRIKKTYNGAGSACSWWLRGPLASSSTLFCSVYSNGIAGNHSATTSNGVAFGFCI